MIDYIADALTAALDLCAEAVEALLEAIIDAGEAAARFVTRALHL